MYNLRGWRIPKGQSKCTIQRMGNTEGAITMYNPEVGEYRRGNQNVQSRGWRIPKGQSKCTISEVGEYRRGNQNVQYQRLENTEGAIKMYNPEVGEYRRGNQNVQSQRLENTEGAIKMYPLENTEGAIKMYNLRGWRIPKGQSKCTPEVGEYRRGNQNVQSQRLENTEGAIKMYPRGWRIPKQSKCTISEVGECRRAITMYSRGWRIPKGQSKFTLPRGSENTEGAITMYNSEVGEYRRGNPNVQPFGILQTSGLYIYRRGCPLYNPDLGLYITEGVITMYPRGWRIPKGQSKCTIQRLENTEGDCTISEVGE